LQLGASSETRVASLSFTANGSPTDFCWFNGATYVNPDRALENYGRENLRGFGTVVIIPRKPLTPDTAYRVAAVVNGQTYDWSFRVE
ncbi:MAG: hypothetical protein ACREQF_12060, partial [Candidatus Binataceae bacterium]